MCICPRTEGANRSFSACRSIGRFRVIHYVVVSQRGTARQSAAHCSSCIAARRGAERRTRRSTSRHSPARRERHGSARRGMARAGAQPSAEQASTPLQKHSHTASHRVPNMPPSAVGSVLTLLKTRLSLELRTAKENITLTRSRGGCSSCPLMPCTLLATASIRDGSLWCRSQQHCSSCTRS